MNNSNTHRSVFENQKCTQSKVVLCVCVFDCLWSLNAEVYFVLGFPFHDSKEQEITFRWGNKISIC